MDYITDGSRFALRITFTLSLLLVSMDIFEIYFEFSHLKELSQRFPSDFFEECIKYHVLSQMFFTGFATFAGLSAVVMSLGLLLDYEFFSIKAAETFFYFNYMIFGPYLLAACILGFDYFKLIVYNCDSKDTNEKTLNFSTLLALILCFLMSILLTLDYSYIHGFKKMINSINFTDEGNHLIGRLFWKYVFSRSNQGRLRLREVNDANNLNIEAIHDDNNLNEPLINRDDR